jgi:hypothetical protein
MQIRMLTVLTSSMSDHKEIYDINMLNILIVLLDDPQMGLPEECVLTLNVTTCYVQQIYAHA